MGKTIVVATFSEDPDVVDQQVFGPFEDQAAAMQWVDSVEDLFEDRVATWLVTQLSPPFEA